MGEVAPDHLVNYSLVNKQRGSSASAELGSNWAAALLMPDCLLGEKGARVGQKEE